MAGTPKLCHIIHSLSNFLGLYKSEESSFLVIQVAEQYQLVGSFEVRNSAKMGLLTPDLTLLLWDHSSYVIRLGQAARHNSGLIWFRPDLDRGLL